MQTNTARNFVLQLGSVIGLYVSVTFFIVLVFGLINLLFPDNLDSIWEIESSASMVRFGLAMVIVFFPTYLYLTRVVNKNRRASTDGLYLGLTKWLIYLSLLIAGLVLLGDLVAVVSAFLNGELTERFLLKALAVLLVTGAAFFYYIKDAQGYWVANEQKSIIYAGVVALVVFGTLALALAHIETPAEVREQKADQEQVQELQQLQWAIEDKLRVEGELITSLDELYSGRPLPEAPEGRPAYEYNLTEDGFELCATFAHDSREERFESFARPMMIDDKDAYISNSNDWYYEAGDWCFARSVIESD